MKKEIVDRIIQLVKRHGVIRPKDMDAYGIHRKYVHMLHHQGLLDRVGRGHVRIVVAVA